MTYLVFEPGRFVTDDGLNINDAKRVGVYVANPAVVVVNLYILLNTYRWDWLMVLITVISMLLIFFWTGVYSAFTAGFTFYKAAPQVYGQVTFWANTCLTVVICLLPRLTAKVAQKFYRPRDVDIVREQVRQGKFDYLKDPEHSDSIPPEKASSTSSIDMSKQKHNSDLGTPEDERPIYPPSVAPTATTRNPRSQNGSDGTNYTGHRLSLEPPARPSFDRPRPSFERIRASMDRIRPSYEQSSDFTSAALLTRLESSNH